VGWAEFFLLFFNAIGCKYIDMPLWGWKGRVHMKKSMVALALVALMVLTILLAGCGSEAVGTLQFKANGEDFVRQGFVSKDGWSINFDHIYVNLADVTAYQTDPPYDPHDAGEIEADVEVELDGSYTVDLAEGGEDAEPILVGQVVDAEVGHYNAISWEMVRATSGPAAGYSLVIMGAAVKGNQTIDFTINIEEEYGYACGEYVGDERKGIVEEGETADVEMTFHFDHVFGDVEAPMDDHINVGAIGFDPFAATAENGRVDIDLAGLQAEIAANDYQTLVETLPTLGHVGEGHCHCY